ncbi:hypothetical protein Leryth_026451 [Lithospermum erythrorhizon]|nr:hypothetical protein Leryth_026451 [Lithospermum erythrorhizon]
MYFLWRVLKMIEDWLFMVEDIMFEIGKDFGEKLSFLNKLLFVMESLKDD